MGSYGVFGKRDWEDELPLAADEILAKSGKVSDLLGAEQVKKKLEEGADPLELSLEKWLRIKDFIQATMWTEYFKGVYEHIGFNTCALCLAAHKKAKSELGELKFAEEKCRFCALAKINGCLQPGSVYRQIESFLFESQFDPESTGPGEEKREKQQKDLQKFLDLIDQMIANLNLVKSGRDSG